LAVDWIATPKYALHLTHLVAQLRSVVTLYTHGNAELASQLQSLLSQSIEKPALVKVDSRRLARLSIKEACAKTVDITFADGTVCEESFLGHAPITKLNGPFAAQLNINVSRTGAEYIVSGPTNATNVKGVYAAGDSTNMLKVWPGAVASGAVTAAGVAIGLQEETWGFSSIFE
jgi:thioredoxin reductase